MKRDEKTILEHVEVLSISLTSFQPLGTELVSCTPAAAARFSFPPAQPDATLLGASLRRSHNPN